MTLDKNDIKEMIRKAGQFSTDYIKLSLVITNSLNTTVEEEYNRLMEELQHRENIILDALSNILEKNEKEHLTLDEIKSLILLSINLGDIIKEEINSSETLNKFRQMGESHAKMTRFPII